MNNKLTKYRKEIYDLVKASKKPLCTKEIEEKLNSSPNLSTIYRALDYLEKNLYLNSIYFSQNLKYYYDKNCHSHFLFCEKCHSIEEFDICFAGKIQRELSENFDFSIKGHSFYFTGICSHCK
jgi:Fur family ferric uptake transcriptional regulator